MKIIEVDFNGRTFPISVFSDGDHVARQMEIPRRFYELDLLLAIQAHARRGVYVDIGAFVGSHSVFFATACRATRVEAFEANPVTFEILLANAVRYGFEAHLLGVHDTFQTVSSIDEAPGNHGMATVVEGGDVLAGPLDCANLSDVAVIKIDVEGHELAVLRGADQTIRRDRPLIAAEAHTAAALAALQTHLRALGYVNSGRYCKTPTYLWVPEAHT